MYCSPAVFGCGRAFSKLSTTRPITEKSVLWSFLSGGNIPPCNEQISAKVFVLSHHIASMVAQRRVEVLLLSELQYELLQTSSDCCETQTSSGRVGESKTIKSTSKISSNLNISNLSSPCRKQEHLRHRRSGRPSLRCDRQERKSC